MEAVTEESIRAGIAGFLKKDIAEVSDEVVLKSLVTDSFVLVELVMTLQEDFNIRLMQEDLKDVQSVGQLVKVIMSKHA